MSRDGLLLAIAILHLLRDSVRAPHPGAINLSRSTIFGPLRGPLGARDSIAQSDWHLRMVRANATIGTISLLTSSSLNAQALIRAYIAS